MSHGLRTIQVIFWAIVIWILTPSKMAALAYVIVIGGLLIAVLISLGIIRGIISAIKRYLLLP